LKCVCVFDIVNSRIHFIALSRVFFMPHVTHLPRFSGTPLKCLYNFKCIKYFLFKSLLLLLSLLNGAGILSLHILTFHIRQNIPSLFVYENYEMIVLFPTSKENAQRLGFFFFLFNFFSNFFLADILAKLFETE
jgi:hypothetical protein